MNYLLSKDTVAYNACPLAAVSQYWEFVTFWFQINPLDLRMHIPRVRGPILIVWKCLNYMPAFKQKLYLAFGVKHIFLK